MTTMLGDALFLTPLNSIQPYWYLLAIPFSFLISMIWKAIRVRDLANYWRHVTVMATLMIVGLVALAILLTLLVEVGIPALPLQRP